MQLFHVTQPGGIPTDNAGTPSQSLSALVTLVAHTYYDATLALHYFSQACTELVQYMQIMKTPGPRSTPNGIPRAIMMRAPHMHARSFLYSLDGFQLAVKAISELLAVPADIALILTDFNAAFPDLRLNRNTAHHIDERLQRLGANGRPNPAITTLEVDSLHGNRYGNTLADGTYGEVEVSAEKMVALQGLFQRLLNTLSWVHNEPSTLPGN